jgi:hypothetical protein
LPPLSTEIEDLEEEECSFVAELSAVYVPFDQTGEEESAPPSWKLERVPEGLKGELDLFTKHRTDPLVRAREGTACVDITVGNDKATVLRFFGWLAATHSITPGLGVFCRPTLSQWAEEWLRALREKGCRFSTLASESLPTTIKRSQYNHAHTAPHAPAFVQITPTLSRWWPRSSTLRTSWTTRRSRCPLPHSTRSSG